MSFNPTASQPLLLVALSGGVDSAVALHFARQASPFVVALTHRHWPESRCCTTECIDHCRDQAKKWNVPFYSIDTLAFFTETIVDPWAQAYQKGITPNPCVQCNEKNRFGKMVEAFFAKYPHYQTEHYKLVTGHYVQTESWNNKILLRRGLDPSKDQSYMLYRLSQKQLKHSWFPVGSHQKKDIRALAQELDLWAAKQQDSQDICFVPDDYRNFWSEYTGIQPLSGNFVDISGKVLGKHKGIPFYTRGQRKGLGLSGGPWYVLEVLPQTNQVVLGKDEDLFTQHFFCTEMVWHIPLPTEALECEIQVRYHGTLLKGKVTPLNSTQSQVHLDLASRDVTPGQSAVFYSGDLVLGGGLIQLHSQDSEI